MAFRATCFLQFGIDDDANVSTSFDGASKVESMRFAMNVGNEKYSTKSGFSQSCPWEVGRSAIFFDEVFEIASSSNAIDVPVGFSLELHVDGVGRDSIVLDFFA